MPPLSHWTARIRRIVSDFAAYLFVRMLVAFIQTLPFDMGDRVCRSLAWLCARVLRIRHSTTDENLRAVFPEASQQERDALEVAMWHHLMLMVCEIAWAQRRLHLTNWRDHMQFRGNREMLSVLLTKRPIIMVSGHFGNFEVGGYMFGMMGCESTTIARKLDNPFLHRWVERFRGAKGQHMVDKEGCAAEVQTHLDNCGTLTILADQHAGDKGHWCDFMGVPASCHKALALFSLGSNAPMIVGYTTRIGGQPMQFESGTEAVADPLCDSDENATSVSALTQWYNHHLAESVSRNVHQYWWLHRRWRRPPEKVARRLAKQAEKRGIARAA